MTGPVGGSRRAAWLAAAALLAAMLAGGAGGFLLARRAQPQRMKEMTLLGISRGPMLDSLGLSPGQRAGIDSVLDRSADRADTIVARMLTDVRAITAETRRQVSERLDERQRARLDSMLSNVLEVRPRSPVPPRATPR